MSVEELSKGVHYAPERCTRLDDKLPDVKEEVSNAVVVLVLVEYEELEV